MIAHKTLDLGSVQLHYVEKDGPNTPVLLLHAALDSWESYHSLLPEFATVAHVYALDFRGHGQSSHSPEGYRVRDHVQDLCQFIPRVIGQQVTLVGHSLGGLVAAWYAARYPDWARGLIDEDSGLLSPPDSRLPHIAGIRDPLLQHKASGMSLEEFETVCAQDSGQGNVTRLEVFGWETVRRHARQRWQMDPRTLDPIIEGTVLAGYVPEEFLPAIKCPTHLIYRLGQEQYAQRIATLIPNCTYTIADTDNHRVHETDPDGYVRAAKGFLRSLSITGS